MKTLSFHNLAIGYHEKSPLVHLHTEEDQVAFDPGVHVLVAPNGRGKSTFLQTVAGVLPPLRGKVNLGNALLDPDSDLFYVSEYLAFPKFIYPHEWVDFISGTGGDDSSLDHLFEEMGLGEKVGSYLGRMSQGERRRVTWVAADQSKRPILLMDEPLDGLDLLATESARRWIQRWKEQGRVLIFVVHQLGDLIDLVDSFWLISEQKLKTFDQIFEGKPWKERSLSELRENLVTFYQESR